MKSSDLQSYTRISAVFLAALYLKPFSTFVPSFSRIVRNKAAERAKVSYNSGSSNSGPNSSGSSGQPGSPGAVTQQPQGAQGQQQQQQAQRPVTPTQSVLTGAPPPPHFSDAALLAAQRPSYSINGILGIQQPSDANANSINKRKRELDEGEAQWFKAERVSIGKNYELLLQYIAWR